MIYLDNNATTFIDPRVRTVLTDFLACPRGNPSSTHRFGQEAKGFLNEATHTIASYFNVRPNELLFTSGATEALNLFVHSILKKTHVITSSLEHVALLEPLKRAECSLTILDPEQGQGSILPHQIEAALRPNTSTIFIMAANNETGIISDLTSIADIAKRHNVALIVDGVALLGKEKLHLHEGISGICFSGHKIHAPPGIGLAIVKKPFKLSPLIIGGVQQYGKRGGTENLPGILAFAKAIELLHENDMEKMRQLRDHFETELKKHLPEITIHGHDLPRASNVSNIAFPEIDGETLLMSLDLAGVAASHGAACSSGSLEPSHVLRGMGCPSSMIRSSLRFSFSRFTTESETNGALETILRTIQKLKN